MKTLFRMKTALAVSAIMMAALVTGCGDAPTPTTRQAPEGSEASDAQGSEAHATVKLTSGNFATTVTESEGVVLVDFWATWCGPCIELAPTVEAVATKYQGKVTVGKLDIDQEGELASKFGIQSIPTLIVFKNGKPVDQIVGLVPQAKIEAALEKQLN